MGAGSTAGNASQLMTTSGTINGTTESAAYTYDNVDRLVTSNQTSNGSSAQRRFTYDRWGNRAGVWDATSGGNQIQSLTLQQSGGVPTNQIASVTSGSTLNYVYDAAGNVTNDGVHSYTYDSENRLASVDGGSTASYAYDNQNRRYKKTVGSTVTHYVWEGSKVVAEHNGSTGAVLIDYVYADSRMIAKVAGGTTQYFLSDRLSTRLVLNTSGTVLGRQAHLPFGEDFAESGTQEKHHFTSYERDSESTIDYALNRGYAAGPGRFHQIDPVVTNGCAMDPQNWNRYSYVKNDPLNLIDPLGLIRVCPPGTHAVNGPNGGHCVSDSPSGELPGTGPKTGPGGGDPPNKRGDPPGGEDPFTGLNPCEKKLVNTMGALLLKALQKSRKIAEEWERQNGGPVLPNGQPNDGNYTNAVKHCIWNCEMTKRMGLKAAYAWGVAHECDANGQPQTNADSAMDLHNNAAGQFYGSKFPNLDCWTSCKTDTYGLLQTSP